MVSTTQTLQDTSFPFTIFNFLGKSILCANPQSTLKSRDRHFHICSHLTLYSILVEIAQIILNSGPNFGVTVPRENTQGDFVTSKANFQICSLITQGKITNEAGEITNNSSKLLPSGCFNLRKCLCCPVLEHSNKITVKFI